ncbi:MAG TPA: hypothetical protein VGZ25_02210 [Gemmataceae bacterium]|jgi:hypothetical protein|nr:hypothetical protein [Gemmataceae bacterium]
MVFLELRLGLRSHAKGYLTILFTSLLMLTQDARAADEYEFVKDTDRWVMVIQGETESIGTLDEAGNFKPDKDWLQMERGIPLSRAPNHKIINGVQEEVYEYRSGRLVAGEIDKDGNFIPTLGTKVIDFKDYVYSPKARKIYNLPGKFVRKGEKKDK